MCVLMLLSCFVVSVCFIACDRQRYKFHGSISDSVDHKNISFVKVKISCGKAKLEPPIEVISDNNGTFILHGYFFGVLDDCQLTFDHSKYKEKIVKLEFKNPGLMQIWSRDVELEPK